MNIHYWQYPYETLVMSGRVSSRIWSTGRHLM